MVPYCPHLLLIHYRTNYVWGCSAAPDECFCLTASLLCCSLLLFPWCVCGCDCMSKDQVHVQVSGFTMSERPRANCSTETTTPSLAT